MDNVNKIFDQSIECEIKPLFIFDVANNHMGDVNHGLKIIRDVHSACKDFPFQLAFKFQFRNIDTFIHPDYKDRKDIKYVKRFSETKLSKEEYIVLKEEVSNLGCISMCTPFDEPSVDLIEEIGFDILKIASCSFNDWPLLEKVATSSKPVIASTGGVDLEVVDQVVSFLQNREKKFVIMHCVGEYPTSKDHLQLNQIDLLQDRYQDVKIGFSTHEEPDNYDAIKMVVAKGVRIFERHVAVKTEKYDINAYSSTPEHAGKWLESAQQAFAMAGVAGQRAEFLEKELSDLRQFKRGVFASRDINKGERVSVDNTFFAFPNQDGQILANSMSKYAIYTATEDIKKNAPINGNVEKEETRERVYKIVEKVDELLKKANIPVSSKLDFEISHHYGIDKFYEYGAVIISCINREYCKKLIVLLPGQKHPVHLHKKKEETFHVLYGSMDITLGGKEMKCETGDIVTVERDTDHDFGTQEGCIFEEVSTTHYQDDSFYQDENVAKNPSRKTHLSHWLD
ncbi:MAG: N-acetylneuraminate synthase family protein [bacterium]